MDGLPVGRQLQRFVERFFGAGGIATLSAITSLTEEVNNVCDGWIDRRGIREEIRTLTGLWRRSGEISLRHFDDAEESPRPPAGKCLWSVLSEPFAICGGDDSVAIAQHVYPFLHNVGGLRHDEPQARRCVERKCCLEIVDSDEARFRDWQDRPGRPYGLECRGIENETRSGSETAGVFPVSSRAKTVRAASAHEQEMTRHESRWSSVASQQSDFGAHDQRQDDARLGYCPGAGACPPAAAGGGGGGGFFGMASPRWHVTH